MSIVLVIFTKKKFHAFIAILVLSHVEKSSKRTKMLIKLQIKTDCKIFALMKKTSFGRTITWNSEMCSLDKPHCLPISLK